MLLSNSVKSEIKAILNFLSQEELLSLAMTVTNRQIDVTTVGEAIEAILTYSQTVEELLKRKKIKREALFRYLASQKIPVDPGGEKHTLIEEIKKYWTKSQGTVTLNDPAQDDSTHYNNEQDTPPRKPREDHIDNLNDTFQFAKQFAEWFYEMLNSCNPSKLGEKGESFTNKHFYTDCRMKLLTKTDSISQEEFCGGDTVHLRLRSFPLEENVTFVPNLEVGGVVAKMSSHGLVLVHVCGTVHRTSEVLGIFEQRFGLVKDPSMEMNWRVKFTHLCLQAGNSWGEPKLGMGVVHMLPNS